MAQQIRQMGFVIIAFLSFLLLSVTGVNANSLPDFTGLVEKYGPTVVNISTTRTVKTNNQQAAPFGNQGNVPPELQDFFQHFFGAPFGGGPEEYNAQSLGSGFIISSDGHIVTNYHVIANADEILVRLDNGQEKIAEVVGADEASDLALLKIDAKNLPYAQFGSSEKLKVGEWVVAIGSPFGLKYTATAGIVSGKGRSLAEKYVPYIQTDVAINPGNSGGPLFDLDGKVIGINAQILSRSGAYIGVSFAIPSDTAVDVIEQLRSNGYVRRGYLGVYFQDVDHDLAESFGFDRASGALVADIVPESPAAQSGLKPGDIIVAFNGQRVESAADLPHFVGKVKPEDTVELAVLREGKNTTVKSKIGELEQEDKNEDKEKAKPASYKNVLGVKARNLTKAEIDKLNLKQPGVVIEALDSSGVAYKAGMRPGDIILSIANEPIKNMQDFERVLKKASTSKNIPVLVSRKGQMQRYFAIKLG